MCKFLYTIVNYAKLVVDDQKTLPLNAKVWLERQKFFNIQDIGFAEQLIKMFGFKCKLSTYYVFELLDCQANVCFASSAESSEKARELLFHVIPLNYNIYLKNPKHNADARKIIERYKSHSTF